jgi:hypothetical protein
MRLSYDEHITKLVSKCIKSLCQINRMKHILDDYTLITVINALVFSRLYTTPHLCGREQFQQKRRQSAQNFAARIVTGKCKFDHIIRRYVNC